MDQAVKKKKIKDIAGYLLPESKRMKKRLDLNNTKNVLSYRSWWMIWVSTVV